MSHCYFDGEVYHKRFAPQEHSFTYPFFMLSIDLASYSKLKNSLFGLERFNLFSFKAKDHFGQNSSFLENIDELLAEFNTTPTDTMYFITLPRVANFVFNPLALLVRIEKGVITHLFAEVHNYNGGRIVYPVSLTRNAHQHYQGSIPKGMYVSPFFDYEGEYRFDLHYTPQKLGLRVDLHKEEGRKYLTAFFQGEAREFSSKHTLKLFLRHSFLTLKVVTRTLWQSLKLYRKGLKWHSPRPQDQHRRY